MGDKLTACVDKVSWERSQRRVADMKALFTLKNRLAAKKSLKSHAWYIWY